VSERAVLLSRWWPHLLLMAVDLWVVLAQGLGYVSAAFGAFVFLWFVFINFLAGEEHQPLDYYSNKVRMRPYLVLVFLIVLAGIPLLISITDRLGLMVNLLPELLIAAYLQGLGITGSILVLESAAASVIAMTAYAFISTGTVLITLIPTFQARRPGVFYSGIYFVLNIIWVIWIGLAVQRLQRQYMQERDLEMSFDDDEDEKRDALVPAGAERVPQIWAQVVCRFTPVLLIVTSMVYGVDYLLEEDEYGWACALAYYITSCLLVVGCCRGFKFGTEL